MYTNFTLIVCFHFLCAVLFLFTFSGWPKRALIARGSERVPMDLVPLSLSRRERRKIISSFESFLCDINFVVILL